MFKLNKSHLNNSVMLNVLKACRESITSAGNVAYVTNRKGNPFLRVKKVVILGKIKFLVTDLTQSKIHDTINSKFGSTLTQFIENRLK